MRKPCKAVAILAVAVASLAFTASASAALSVVPAGEPNGFVAETSSTVAGAAADDIISFTLDPAPLTAPGGGTLRDTIVDLPAGLAGNPESAPKCVTLLPVGTNLPLCPLGSQVGTVDFSHIAFGIPFRSVVPLFNMAPERGQVADLAFILGGTTIPIHIGVSLRPDDYGIRTTTLRTSQYLPISNVSVKVWGVPADPSHDAQRCVSPQPESGSPFDPTTPWICSGPVGDRVSGSNPSSNDQIAFFRNSTSCDSPQTTTISISSWQDPDVFESESATASLPTECDRVPFDPSLVANPTTAAADSPSSLAVDLSIPQSQDPGGLASSALKKAVVTLPEGVSVNPASAGGLGSCSPRQIGLGTNDPVSCPNASKIGMLELRTPLLHDPVPGSVYLASPNDNPTGSLIALYLVISDPDRGLLVKLPGKVELDPQTGRLAATFDDSPQLPFESLHVEFKTGDRAPLITPAACGLYTTEADLYSWARPTEPVHSESSFEISSGPGGAPCPSAAQFDPSFEAGTVIPLAGVHSPLVLNASRPDGSAPLSGLTVRLPEGLTGKLAGIDACSDAGLAAAAAREGRAELASPSCPVAAKVGTVDVGAGAGGTPFHVSGQVYLAGPYKGAPLSLAVITPAVAGPFDLGTVVTRASAKIDPATTQIEVVSDPIPQILEGIPLRVRSASVDTDRPNFILNPTSCDPMSIDGTLFSSPAKAPVSSRFQVGGCGDLNFRPKLTLTLKGATHRRAHPRLIADLRTRPGEANIARAQVKLPKAAFLDNAHIGDVCTRVQFAAGAGNGAECPPGSIYGRARATSPLLDYAVSGNAYLRSSSNPLPDLVIAFRGPDRQPITVELAGRTDSVKGALRNTFAAVPDVPVSSFHLELFGGKKGLIELSSGLCAHPRATIKLDAQNGAAHDTRPKVKTGCGKKRNS